MASALLSTPNLTIEKGLEVWLESHLEQPWTSENISSFLTPEVVAHLVLSFRELDTPVKIRVLFAFLGIRKSVYKDLEKDFNRIVELAKDDDDEWVRVIASLFTHYCTDQQFELNLQNSTYVTLLSDLKSKLYSTRISYQPYEAAYVNRSLLSPEDLEKSPEPHFKLKKPLDPRASMKPQQVVQMKKPISMDEIAPSTSRTPAQKLAGMFASPNRTGLASSSGLSTPRTPLTAGGASAGSSHMSGVVGAKKKQAMVIDLKEVQELQQQAEISKREKLEKAKQDVLKKKREKQDELEMRKNEREEKKRKKEEEQMQRKQQIEERRIEKEGEGNSTEKKKWKKSSRKVPPLPAAEVGVAMHHHPAAAHAMMMQAFPPPVNPLDMAAPLFPSPISGLPSRVPSLLQGPPSLPPPQPQAANSSALLHQPTLMAASMLASFQNLGDLAAVASAASQPQQTAAVTPVAPAAAAVAVGSLFDSANVLTAENRELIAQFLNGNRINPSGDEPLRQIVLNEETKANPAGGSYLEQIIFEINYASGTWKKLRRKKAIAPPGGGVVAMNPSNVPPAAAASSSSASSVSNVAPGAVPMQQ